MAQASAELKRPRRLSELLADGRPWPADEGLRLVHRLAVEVLALHASGRTHRAIQADAIFLDARRQPHLAAPPAAALFGGEASDPKCCPPELAAGDELELPPSIEAAAALLSTTGQEFDPRRID